MNYFPTIDTLYTFMGSKYMYRVGMKNPSRTPEPTAQLRGSGWGIMNSE